MRCPFCKSHLDNNAKYCNECGTAVDSECSGKNINYRSYNDTRPNTNFDVPKVQPGRINPNKVRENPFADKNRQQQKPPVSVMPSTTYAMSNANTRAGNSYKRTSNVNAKKKNGCGIIVLIIIILFSIFSVIGAVLGEEENNNSDFNENNNGYYNQDEYYNDEEDSIITAQMHGRFDGSYYLNDWVNFAFKVPDEFENISGSLSSTDYDGVFKSDDGSIITGYELYENTEDFLSRFMSLAIDDIKDLDIYDGSNLKTLETEKKEIGDKDFYGLTSYCGDLDGECRIVSIYATAVDDYVFFIKIYTASPETNKAVIDSFVEAHTDF